MEKQKVLLREKIVAVATAVSVATTYEDYSPLPLQSAKLRLLCRLEPPNPSGKERQTDGSKPSNRKHRKPIPKILGRLGPNARPLRALGVTLLGLCHRRLGLSVPESPFRQRGQRLHLERKKGGRVHGVFSHPLR